MHQFGASSVHTYETSILLARRKSAWKHCCCCTVHIGSCMFARTKWTHEGNLVSVGLLQFFCSNFFSPIFWLQYFYRHRFHLYEENVPKNNAGTYFSFLLAGAAAAAATCLFAWFRSRPQTCSNFASRSYSICDHHHLSPSTCTYTTNRLTEVSDSIDHYTSYRS